MVPEPLVQLANFLQITIPVMSLLAYLPQWTKLRESRDSGAISTRAWALWTLAAVFAMYYAVVQLLLNGRGWALVISSGAGLLFVTVTLALVLRFRRRPPPA
ncbi:MAG: hypothetical protein RLZZ129_2382 [Verrucomicrobiota bacterium]|jgi:uncharacterized protein with PQ loop repeat